MTRGEHHRQLRTAGGLHDHLAGPRAAPPSRTATRAPRTDASGPSLRIWRWRWDLNPRRSCPLTRFRGALLRPLGHATAVNVRRTTLYRRNPVDSRARDGRTKRHTPFDGAVMNSGALTAALQLPCCARSGTTAAIRAPSPLVSPGSEELAQRLGALGGPHATDDLNTVQSARVAWQIPHRAARTGLRVPGTEDDAPYARAHRSTGAHDTRLQRDHQHTAVKTGAI